MTLKQRGKNLLDNWESVVKASVDAAAERCYSPFDPGRKGKALLFTVLEEDKPKPGTPDAVFSAPTSMRDVENSVHLWIERTNLNRGSRDGE